VPHLLPREHRFAHDYAIYLHDLVVGLLKRGAEAHVFDVTIEADQAEQALLQTLSGEALFDWIAENKDQRVSFEMDYKSVFAAVATDLCHFALEGLRAAAKGKLTVAYALFRKPLCDDLFCLEWLLADPHDFLGKFRESSPRSIEIGSLEATRRRAIVEEAVRLAGGPGVAADRVYELRFDRASPASLARSWDQALHLVTTFKAIQTEPTNLNFVFSGRRELETQWANVYWCVPYLLYHTSWIVDALFATIAMVDEEYAQEKWLRRAVGYELWAEYGRRESPRRKLPQPLAELLGGLRRECPSCSVLLAYHRRNLRCFVKHGSVLCSSCGNATSPIAEHN